MKSFSVSIVIEGKDLIQWFFKNLYKIFKINFLCYRYEGRFPAASTAAGNKQLHEQELDAFMSNVCNPDYF